MPVTVPEYITVHLGAPNAPAKNVTVPFADYIKNVASSEIYPTWPEEAIRANIYAQTSYTLNRIFTEYYRSRGYDFILPTQHNLTTPTLRGVTYLKTSVGLRTNYLMIILFVKARLSRYLRSFVTE